MIYLLLTIFGNVAIFMAFRSFSHFKINTFPAIIVNYFVCILTGLAYAGPQNVFRQWQWNAPWLWSAVFLGIIFVSTFYLMARTTQLRGVSVASVASKMSLAIPVVFSLFVFKYGVQSLDVWNKLGIGLSLVAIFMVSKKPKLDIITKVSGFRHFLLPLAVFLLGGLIDTTLNYVNSRFVTETLEPVFPIFIFCFAFTFGITFALLRKIPFRLKDILGGIYLGIPNYFSIYFLLKTLRSFDNNGAWVYPFINIGIIIGSTLLALFLFREKLSRLNFLGIILSVIVIYLLGYQEILKAL